MRFNMDEPPALPKGMKLPDESLSVLSQHSRNYSGEILQALQTIEGLTITVEQLDVTESIDQYPLVRLVLVVKEDEERS